MALIRLHIHAVWSAYLLFIHTMILVFIKHESNDIAFSRLLNTLYFPLNTVEPTISLSKWISVMLVLITSFLENQGSHHISSKPAVKAYTIFGNYRIGGAAIIKWHAVSTEPSLFAYMR